MKKLKKEFWLVIDLSLRTTEFTILNTNFQRKMEMKKVMLRFIEV